MYILSVPLWLQPQYVQALEVALPSALRVFTDIVDSQVVLSARRHEARGTPNPDW